MTNHKGKAFFVRLRVIVSLWQDKAPSPHTLLPATNRDQARLDHSLFYRPLVRVDVAGISAYEKALSTDAKVFPSTSAYG